MFKQGMFLIDPNATPEQIKAQREALARLTYGRASNVGEGVGDLLQGFAAGVQKRGLNRAESSGRESAMEGFKAFLSGEMGGENAESVSPTVEQPSVAPVVTGSVSAPPSGGGDLKSGISETAASLGIDPVDLATAISYETMGTFDPTKRGPTTQWGQHRGLIQFGEPQAKQYGVNWDDPYGSQLGPDGAVAKYLRDTGVKPGMGLLDIYSAINAGGVGRYNRSDANNGGAPGTVRDKVEKQMAGHRAKAMAMFGGDAPTGAAQAVNAMAQGGQPAPQPTGGIIGSMLAGSLKPQQAQGAGSAMDVWQGRAGQGTANDGSSLQRLPDGSVKRTSGRYDYSEIMRPEGMPSERAPMPRQAQGGGIGSFIANALSGRGNAQTQQPAPQPMPEPVMDPATYNEQVVRMSPDLGGPMRADVPQGQPPIPGIQPTAPTISEMSGRMPAPQGQPMAQGVDGLRNAMQPQQAQAPAPQAMPPQIAPQQAPQPAPAPQQLPQQQPQGVDQQWLMQAMRLANNPFLPEAERATLQAIIQQRTQAADPMRQLEMDYKRAQLDQLRNPVDKPTETMRNLEWRAEQAGLTPGTQEYRDFVLSGGSKDGVTVNVGQGSSKYNDELDKRFAEQYITMQEGAQAAQGKLATLQGLQSALEQSSFTGMGAETLLGVKQAARSLGLDVGDNLGPEETARALGNQLALQMRNPSSGAGMPGAMSDKDREFLVASVPGLSKTPEGNRQLVNFMTQIEQRNIQVAQRAQEYADRNGQIDNGFYKELSAWSEQNPLFPEADQQQAPATGNQPTIQPGTMDGEYRFKGGDPSDQNNWERVM